MDQDPAIRLMTSVGLYETRFGHAVPQLQHLSREQLQEMIDNALSSGQPVPGWAEMQKGDVMHNETRLDAQQPTPYAKLKNPPTAEETEIAKAHGFK